MEIINQLIGIILGSGIIGTMLFYNHKKRKEGASAYKLELEGLKEEIIFLTERLEKVRDETSKLRDDFVSLKEYSMKLEIELLAEKQAHEISENYSCHTKECQKRISPKKYYNEPTA